MGFTKINYAAWLSQSWPAAPSRLARCQPRSYPARYRQPRHKFPRTPRLRSSSTAVGARIPASARSGCRAPCRRIGVPTNWTLGYTDEWGWYWVSDDVEADWGWVAITTDVGHSSAVSAGSGCLEMTGRRHGSTGATATNMSAGRRCRPTDWSRLTKSTLLTGCSCQIVLSLRLACGLTSCRRTGARSFCARLCIVNRTVPVHGRLAVNPGISPAFVARMSGAPVATYRVRPRVFASTQGVAGAVQVRREDLRGARGGRPAGPGGPGERARLGAISVQRTTTGDSAKRSGHGAAATSAKTSAVDRDDRPRRRKAPAIAPVQQPAAFDSAAVWIAASGAGHSAANTRRHFAARRRHHLLRECRPLHGALRRLRPSRERSVARNIPSGARPPEVRRRNNRTSCGRSRHRRRHRRHLHRRSYGKCSHRRRLRHHRHRNRNRCSHPRRLRRRNRDRCSHHRRRRLHVVPHRLHQGRALRRRSRLRSPANRRTRRNSGGELSAQTKRAASPAARGNFVQWTFAVQCVNTFLNCQGSRLSMSSGKRPGRPVSGVQSV